MRFAFVVCSMLVSLLGCAPRSTVFEDRPVVWYDDDARDIPEPEPRRYVLAQDFLDVVLFRRSPRALELRDLEPARNTNALDEVPNSTWFTNRIGVRLLTPEEAARGPTGELPPQLPLLVVDGKSGGLYPGLLVRDATGRKFLLKVDPKKNPGMQTGNEVVVSRIFWAIGYNVPQNTLVRFHREDLRVDPNAQFQPSVGKVRALKSEDVDAMLDEAARQEDGSYRGSASQILDGTPLGGAPAEGVRRDDPNDRVRHEHRRELRGLRVFSAWLSHTDVKEDNLLDMYVEEDGRRFVRHYLIDFSEALGGHEAVLDRPEQGWEFMLDWEKNGLSLVALGLWERPWEGREGTPWPSIGAYSAEGFEPEIWREAVPYWPFFEMDPADAYWAAKIVMRFDRRIVRAIVDTGQFPDDASEYLVETIMARGRKVGRVYIESVTALDAFHFVGNALCAYDLGIVYGLASRGHVERLDADRAPAVYAHRSDGRVCIPVPANDRYRVARLRTCRDGECRPPMQVHFKGGEDARLLGIVRSEKGPCIRGRGRPRCR